MVKSIQAKHWIWLYRCLPLLICILAAFGSLQPFHTGEIPFGADTVLHLYRISGWERLWSQGIIYTQWMPDFALGYGYPLANYHPPLAYWFGVIMRLLGLSLQQAMTAVWLLISVIASTGMYYTVRSLTKNTIAGVVAAVAYAYAPYTLFNILTRGSFAEATGISFAPWLFFSIFSYTRNHQLRFGLLLTVCFVAVLLSHVISSLLLAPVVIVLILVGAVYWRGLDSHEKVIAVVHTILGGLSFFVLALGLAAFFWLPPQFELSLVQMERGTSGYASFASHFLSLQQLFAPPSMVDLNYVGQYIPPSLSWISVTLLLLALVNIVRSSDLIKRIPALAFATIALVTGLMTLPIAQVIWERLTILRFLQYPFRFISIATLSLSVVAGLGYDTLSKWIGVNTRNAKLFQAVFVFTLLAGLAVYAYTWQMTKPDPFANATSGSATEMWKTEQKLGTTGTTSFGEYLPKDVQLMPQIPAFSDEVKPDRLDVIGLPVGAKVSNAIFGALTYHWDIQTPMQFTATLRTFFFPGWFAMVDGVNVPLAPSAPYGQIQVLIPAGNHHVLVEFGLSPIRKLASAISIASLFVLAGVVIRGIFVNKKLRQAGFVDLSPADNISTNQPFSNYGIALIGVGTLALVLALAFKTIVVDRSDTIFSYSRLIDQHVQGASDTFDVNFGNTLHLIGGDIPIKRIKAGQILDFVLYWQLYALTKDDFSIKTDVVDEHNTVFGQFDTVHPNGIFPTSRITPNEYIGDERHINIADFAPPGEYQIRVSVYHKDSSGKRLTVLDKNGAPIGTTYEATAITVFTVTVDRPDYPASNEQINVDTVVNKAIENDIVLLGHSLPVSIELHVGDSFAIDTYWQATRAPQVDIEVCFDLSLASQAVSLTCAAPVPRLPTSQWHTGDVWLSSHAMRIPPSLAGGTYTLTLRSNSANASQSDVFVSTLKITAPDRITDLPANLHSQSFEFTNGIMLVGYADIQRSTLGTGQVLTVSLYWRTNVEIDKRYKSFVHIVDANGDRIAGNDQIPGNGRPTTDWVPGEYVLDTHVVTIPQDLRLSDVMLKIGLYDEGDLKRLMLKDGEDAALIVAPIIRAR